MYTKIFLRLEPLGIELIAAELRRAGHEVRLIDLQVESHADYFRQIREWRPDVVVFSVNYLANVPEVIDLARATRSLRPGTFVAVGGHSASFVAGEMIEHSEGAIDCVVKGEGEASAARLVEAAAERDPMALLEVPGAITAAGSGPPPGFSRDIDSLRPARDLLRPSPQVLHRRARPVRVDRVQPRLSLGLLVLQRMDVLRPQLPDEVGRGRGGRAGVDPGAGDLHRRRRRVHPARARHGHRRGHRPARDQEALLPRDPRRRPASQQGRLPVLEDARACSTCSWGSRRSTRRG